MREQIDPKVVIAKAKAEAKLEDAIKATNPGVYQTLQLNRGKSVLLLMKDNTLREGMVKLCTPGILMLDEQFSTGLSRIEVENIAAIEA